MGIVINVRSRNTHTFWYFIHDVILSKTNNLYICILYYYFVRDNSSDSPSCKLTKIFIKKKKEIIYFIISIITKGVVILKRNSNE